MIMRDNTLMQRLREGKAAFGVMCTFPSPAVVEMLGYLGFDWILLDNEHGSIALPRGAGGALRATPISPRAT